MDLIILRPGKSDIIGEDSSTYIDNIADKTWLRDPIFKFDKCLELVSIHQGMKQQITTDVSNKARTSGRPVITEFTCVKYVDQTSVKLYDYCLRAETLGSGKEEPTMLYIARNSGDRRKASNTHCIAKHVLPAPGAPPSSTTIPLPISIELNAESPTGHRAGFSPVIS